MLPHLVVDEDTVDIIDIEISVMINKPTLTEAIIKNKRQRANTDVDIGEEDSGNIWRKFAEKNEKLNNELDAIHATGSSQNTIDVSSKDEDKKLRIQFLIKKIFL